MIYVLFGGDDFSIAQALKAIEAEWPEPALLPANSSQLDGGELGAEELAAVCNALPFFAPRRLVVVRGLIGRFQNRSQSEETTAYQAYLRVMEAQPTSTVLVLIEGELRGDNPLFQALQPLAQVRSFPVPQGGALLGWIKQRVAQGGATISPRAARLIAELVGDDLWALANEVEKLSLLVQGREIAEEDVEASVYQAREVNIFRLVDALLQGEMGAGRWLHRMLQEGVKPQRIIAMLARQLRILVQLKEFLAQGLPAAEIRRRLGLPSFALQQSLSQARDSSWPKLKETYDRLLETDLAIKRGRWGEELALDLFLASLAQDKVG